MFDEFNLPGSKHSEFVRYLCGTNFNKVKSKGKTVIVFFPNSHLCETRETEINRKFTFVYLLTNINSVSLHKNDSVLRKPREFSVRSRQFFCDPVLFYFFFIFTRESLKMGFQIKKKIINKIFYNLLKYSFRKTLGFIILKFVQFTNSD